jgi:hypothetical protein
MILVAQVGSIAKSIPEIIKQASQSQLGILALLIIVLFGLAFYFFRKAPVRWRALIFLVFFSGVCVYAWEINRVAGRPVSVHYVGRVLDKLTSAPLPESKITVTFNSNSQPPRETDSDGQFSFWLSRTDPTQDATVHVDHVSYAPYERIVASDASNQLGNIPLTLVTQTASASAEGAPGGAAGTTPRPPASLGTGASVGAIVGRPQLGAAVSIRPPMAVVRPPLSELESARPPAKMVEVSSGPKPSGIGKDWSEWYQVRIGAAPAGYTIEKVDFWLSGDRACNAWAECKELSKDDAQTLWQFRLQGHDEWGAPRQANSEGHLRATYKPR